MGNCMLLWGLVVLSLSGCLSGCMMQANNGETFSGSNIGRSIEFSGFSLISGETIAIQVMEDPTAASPVWAPIATTTPSIS